MGTGNGSIIALNRMTERSTRAGFTLIELIIVIAIIAIISAAVFVAIDPARRLHAARNSSRWADVTAVLEAVKKYQVDNDGDLPATAVAIDSAVATVQLIGQNIGPCNTLTCSGTSIVTSGCGVSGLGADLAPYLKKIPKDPKTGSANDTRYHINKDAYGLLSVGACDEEGEGQGGAGDVPEIEVSR